MKVLNSLMSFIYSVGLFGMFLFVGLMILDSSDNFIAKVGFLLTICMGLYASYWLFMSGNKNGLFNLIGESKASHNLDEVMHQNDPNVTSSTTKQWVDELQKNKINFQGGYINLWGFGRDHDLNSFNELYEYKLNASGKLMLTFKNGNRLHIHGAEDLYYSKTFIKFINITKVKWMWDHGKKFIECTYNGSTINTEGNINWRPKSLDFNMSAAPVVIWRHV